MINKEKDKKRQICLNFISKQNNNTTSFKNYIKMNINNKKDKDNKIDTVTANKVNVDNRQQSLIHKNNYIKFDIPLSIHLPLTLPTNTNIIDKSQSKSMNSSYSELKPYEDSIANIFQKSQKSLKTYKTNNTNNITSNITNNINNIIHINDKRKSDSNIKLNSVLFQKIESSKFLNL